VLPMARDIPDIGRRADQEPLEHGQAEMWNFLTLLPSAGYQWHRYPEQRKRFVITGITAFVATTVFLLLVGAYIGLLLDLISSLRELHGAGAASQTPLCH
jgi:hypothetical protein